MASRQILNVYSEQSRANTPPTMFAQPRRSTRADHLSRPSQPPIRALFETALLQACDALDGVTDGVVDNVPACVSKFNPSAARYTDYTGAFGPAGTTYSLQCTGAKNATCLSPAQIQAAIQINQGPRRNGSPVAAPAGAVAPDHVDNTVQGYAYDGGWMTTVGIPARKIGTATSVPGDATLGLGSLGLSLVCASGSELLCT